MFSGLNFLFIEKGIGTVQINILKKKVETNGGTISLSLNLKTNKIITTLDYSKVIKCLKISNLPRGIQIHTVEWITSSLIEGKKLADNLFLVEIPNNSLLKRKATKEIDDYKMLKKQKISHGDIKYHGGIKSTKGGWLSSILEEDETNEINHTPDFDFNSSYSDLQHLIEKSSSQLKLEEDQNEKSDILQLDEKIVKTSLSQEAETLRLDYSDDERDSIDSSQKKLVRLQITSSESDELFTDSDSEAASTTKLSEYVMSLPEIVKGQNKRNYFACQKTPDKISNSNLNKHITDFLEVLEKTSHSKGDKWRAYAYGKAIRILRSLKFKIESINQVKNLPGIGDRMAGKISEILSTGKLRRVEEVLDDDQTVVFNLFSDIFGAGPATIQKWYAQGYRTLEDLKSSKGVLTAQQEIGVRYYHEFKQRISRDEVTKLANIVISKAKEIDSRLKLVVCGSYRRGKDTCGDVDILITHKKTNCLRGLVHKLINDLHQINFLTDDLTKVKIEDGDKYMGVCQLNSNSPHRRIDIKAYPRDEWPSALMYFTGSDHFNRSIRLWARKCGMSLSEHHLVRRYGKEKQRDAIIPVKTEKDIFTALGLEYMDPRDRDV